MVSIRNNSAIEAGGGILSVLSNVISSAKHLYLTGNKVVEDTGLFSGSGGAVLIVGGEYSPPYYVGSFISRNSVHFLRNSAGRGAAILYYRDLEYSRKSYLTSENAAVSLLGFSNFTENTASSLGGAININNGNLIMSGESMFSGNEASYGGAIYTVFDRTINILGPEPTLSFEGNIIFTHNKANVDGGAICSLGINIIFENDTKNVSFEYNSAENGGAMYLKSGTMLILRYDVEVYTSHNYASKRGGGIYYQDTATLTQCNFELSKRNKLYAEDDESIELVMRLPYCFIYSQSDIKNISSRTKIYSYNDTAELSGSFMYGGLLD